MALSFYQTYLHIESFMKYGDPMQSVFSSRVIDRALLRIESYKKLTDLLQSTANNEGKCSLSVKVLSNFMDTTTQDITSTLKKLSDFGIIQSNRSLNEFKVLQPDLEQSPIGLAQSLLRLLVDKPDCSFQQQADELQVSLQELEILYGYFVIILK
ncbi:hypothetical protein [Paenibacillus sp. OAS669]|uniref:hypothetical protein n=1 Tax=Paenibacillus sp. OAS669 TaxID=2663821 RepID=UPI00178B0BC4|nr:hypothetical protein [Paenibacillus sp. OAS669]MBE1441590.1 hypothetical protein [Paenibacillus sp. OAS669]